jgi:XTP/dITP diphosphohydrolase
MFEVRIVTLNPHKFQEAATVLRSFGIKAINAKVKTPELQAETLEEVALHRALYAIGRVAAPFAVEDAGLFIKALKGFPGVFSSQVFRKLGCEGILKLMDGVADREAYFKSVVAFVDWDGRVHLFKGVVNGEIATEARGEGGFGFDPIFIPRGSKLTFAEGRELKILISHRTRAFQRLGKFVREVMRQLG